MINAPWYKIISLQFLPPAIICYTLLIGIILLCCKKIKPGCILISIAAFVLYALSLPAVSYHLAKILQPAPLTAKAIANTKAKAIVVLSGGNNYFAPEYNHVVLSNTNLIRLRYGAYLNIKTKLPILLSGASAIPSLPAEAQSMAATLKNIWKIKARWIESKSINTAENALYSAKILRDNNIKTILLVTSATHMPRAKRAFEEQGLKVTAAATDYIGPVRPNSGLYYFTPRASAFLKSYLCVYEYYGLIWYLPFWSHM